MTHKTDKPKTAEQIEGEISELLDDFATTAEDIPSMCWDTHKTDTTNKILALCKSQIEKEYAKRIFERIERDYHGECPLENCFVYLACSGICPTKDCEWWQQLKKEFLGE
jgi:site-specific recombinase